MIIELRDGDEEAAVAVALVCLIHDDSVSDDWRLAAERVATRLRRARAEDDVRDTYTRLANTAPAAAVARLDELAQDPDVRRGME